MKKVAALLLGLLLLVGCSTNEDIPSNPSSDIDKTMFVYLIGQNNGLENHLKANVSALAAGLALMKSPAQVLIYWDASEGGTYWNKSSILRYTTNGDGLVNGKRVSTEGPRYNADGSPKLDANDLERFDAADIVKEYPSQIATDKEVMRTVIKDMMTLSSNSTFHGIAFGSHGSGWLKRIDSANSRSLGYDGDYENSITIPDLADVLKVAGKKFDFLLFDACMMACAEVFYDVRQVTDYAIASVIDVPSLGFVYSYAFSELMQFTVAGYQNACDRFVDYYSMTDDTNRKNWFGSISLVNCNEMNALAVQVKEQINDNKDLIGFYDSVDFQFYGNVNSGFKLLSADIVQFIRSLNEGELPVSFEEQFDRTLLYKAFVNLERGDKFYNSYYIDGANYSGMGLYLPMQSKRYWNEYFQTLAWCEAAGWNAVTWPLPQ